MLIIHPYVNVYQGLVIVIPYRAKAPVQDEAPVGPHPDKKAGKSWHWSPEMTEKDGGNDGRIGGTQCNAMEFWVWYPYFFGENRGNDV